MEFTIPSTLRDRLAPYDPELKRRRDEELARQRLEQEQARVRSAVTAKSGRARRYGMPLGILPNTVVHPDVLQRALEYINKAPSIHKHEHWLTPDGGFLAAIWLITSKMQGDFWFAAWANPTRDALYLRVMAKADQGKSPYLRWRREPAPDSFDYGRSCSERLLDGSRTVPMGGTLWDMRDFRFSEAAARASADILEPSNVIAYGAGYTRSDCSCDSFRHNTYDRVLRYLSGTLSRQIDSDKLRTTQYGSIPNVFTKIHERPIDHLPGSAQKQLFDARVDQALTYGQFRNQWLPDLAWIDLPKPAQTPWFRGFFQARINTALAAWSDNDSGLLERQLGDLLCFSQELKAILMIWPDASCDHLQALLQSSLSHWVALDLSHWVALDLSQRNPRSIFSHQRFIQVICPWLDERWNASLKTPRSELAAAAVLDWIRQQIPITSWIRWIAEENPTAFETLGRNLLKLANAGSAADPLSLPRPKRWRFEAFMDVLAEQVFRATTPDQTMPQDLFPGPITITTTGGKFTFFQPRSTHQLAAWGQAVRNCVGNGSYASRVQQRQAFIVLGLLNHKPTFTVQLSLRDGVLHVDQLVGLSNQHLEPETRSLYERAMADALQQAAQLTSDDT